MSDSDWSRDNGNVVLRAYGSIAVHENPYGDVVVRQERDALDDEDHWVVIPVQDAELRPFTGVSLLRSCDLAVT